MKNNIFKILLCFATIITQDGIAQQVEFYENSYENFYLINSASITNLENNIGLVVQKNMTSFPGSPNSQKVWVNGNISDMENFSIGAIVSNRSSFGLTNAKINFTGSYKINLNSNSSLSAGLSLGIGNQYINFEKFNIEDWSENIFTSAYRNKSFADGDFGLEYFLQKRMKLGISVQNIFRNNIGFENSVGQKVGVFKLSRQYNIYGTYLFNLSESVTLNSMLFMHSYEGLPVWLSFTNVFEMKEAFSAGFSLKANRRVSFLLGYKLQENLNFNYALSINNSINKHSSFNSTLHEIMVSFSFRKGNKNTSNVTTSNTAEYEIIDQLREENIDKQRQLEEQKKTLDQHQQEIDRLTELMSKNNYNLLSEQERNQLLLNSEKENSNRDYFVIVGALTTTEDAHKFQNIFKTRTGSSSFIIKGNAKYYFVCIEKKSNKVDAIALTNRLNKDAKIKNAIVGNVWIYIKNN